MSVEEGKKGRLVLKRKQGEKIVLGNGSIVITNMGNDRLCIECPKDIAVHRHEVFVAIKKERELE